MRETQQRIRQQMLLNRLFQSDKMTCKEKIGSLDSLVLLSEQEFNFIEILLF